MKSWIIIFALVLVSSVYAADTFVYKGESCTLSSGRVKFEVEHRTCQYPPSTRETSYSCEGSTLKCTGVSCDKTECRVIGVKQVSLSPTQRPRVVETPKPTLPSRALEPRLIPPKPTPSREPASSSKPVKRSCEGFLEGYEFSPMSQKCVRRTANGCGTTFEYKTSSECEKAHPKRALTSPIRTPPSTCQAFFEGFEFNVVSHSCVRRTTTGCSNPFAYETELECARAHPRRVTIQPIGESTLLP